MDEPDPVIAGETLTYTLVITNASGVDATGVVVTDTLPVSGTFSIIPPLGWTCTTTPNSFTCQTSVLPAMETRVITVVVPIPSYIAPNSVITNTVGVTSALGDSSPADNVDEEETRVLSEADLSIAKSAWPSVVSPGEEITYTLTVYNAGPSAAYSVVVSDTLPGEVSLVAIGGSGWTCTVSGSVVTCTRGSIAAGAYAPPLYIVTRVNPDVPPTATIANVAVVGSSHSDDPDGGNNSDDSQIPRLGGCYCIYHPYVPKVAEPQSVPPLHPRAGVLPRRITIPWSSLVAFPVRGRQLPVLL